MLEIEAQVELPLPAGHDRPEVGATRDVISKNHIPTQVHPETQTEASPGTRYRFEFLPRVAGIAEDGALDARQVQPAERDTEHEVVEEGETILEVREIEARAVDAAARIAAQRVRAAHDEALRIGAVRDPALKPHRERRPLAHAHIAAEIGAQREILRVARVPVRGDRTGQVVALAVAWAGGEPERVVADEGEGMAREEALAVRAVLAQLLVVVPLRAPLDAAEARERIGGDERAAGLPLEVVVAERVPEIVRQVEHADAVVPAVLAIHEPPARVHPRQDVARRLRGVAEGEDEGPVSEEVAEGADQPAAVARLVSGEGNPARDQVEAVARLVRERLLRGLRERLFPAPLGRRGFEREAQRVRRLPGVRPRR